MRDLEKENREWLVHKSFPMGEFVYASDVVRNGRIDWQLSNGPPNPFERNAIRGVHPRVECRMSIHTRRRRRHRRSRFVGQFVGRFVGHFVGRPQTRIYPATSIHRPSLVETRLCVDRRVDSRMRRDETRQSSSCEILYAEHIRGGHWCRVKPSRKNPQTS